MTRPLRSAVLGPALHRIGVVRGLVATLRSSRTPQGLGRKEISTLPAEDAKVDGKRKGVGRRGERGVGGSRTYGTVNEG